MSRKPSKTVSEKVEAYRTASQRAGDWLVAHQHPDGSIDPAGGIGSMYKATFALVTSGRLDAAWRLMDYIAERYMTAPGEFHAENETDFQKAVSFYRTTYIVRAAIALGGERSRRSRFAARGTRETR